MIRIKLDGKIVSIDLGDANQYRFGIAIDYWRCVKCREIQHSFHEVCFLCMAPASAGQSVSAGDVLDAHYVSKTKVNKMMDDAIKHYHDTHSK